MMNKNKRGYVFEDYVSLASELCLEMVMAL